MNFYLLFFFGSVFSYSWKTPKFYRRRQIMCSENAPKNSIPAINWYVVGESKSMRLNKPYKTTIWGHEYVFWKNKKEGYVAMDDRCPHRGASLSIGHLTNENTIACPYHGYEFSKNGTLVKVPGLNFKNTPCQNVKSYPIVEKNGWIYLNILPSSTANSSEIFDEPEASDPLYSVIFIKSDFQSYARVVSENSLDIMHIGFVHTFGNRESPSPVKEIPPHQVGNNPHHYRSKYDYISGKDSMVKRLFYFPNLSIENEFVLPHTTVARVIFGEFVSTVITFATPINDTHTKLYVKTYRNFWGPSENVPTPVSNIMTYFGNAITEDMMRKTVNQDKRVIENIPMEYIQGKFNMKYDKLQNVYRSIYKGKPRSSESSKAGFQPPSESSKAGFQPL